MTSIRFPSHGVSCAAWHLTARTDDLAGPAGRPCVVMAHGFGGTRDTGLLAYAEPFADAGLDVLVFDYRGFGDSDGTPRQDVSYRRQRQDYHAAVDAARHLPGVDRDRIALWGTSYSAGHVVVVAAQDRRVAAVVSLTPSADGLASLALIARHEGIGRLVRLAGHGVIDAAGAVAGRAPHTVAIVGRPGTTSMINAAGAAEAYTALAGPTWRNETTARHALEVACNRPTVHARRVRCPVLVQIGTDDRIVPIPAARRMATRAGATVQHYPVGHFDVYDGAWQQQVLADQIAFFGRTLR